MIGALVARKAVAAAFDAMNRHDLRKFMSTWRDEGVFVYPGDIPESGIYRGRDAVEGWFRRFFEQFPTIQFRVRDLCVRNLFDLVGRNAVAVHWDIRLVNRDGREGRNRGVTVAGLEGGKVSQVNDYIFDLGDDFRRNWGARVQQTLAPEGAGGTGLGG